MPPRGKGKRKGKQTHRKTAASASNSVSFNREVISTILSRLPVKTLLRFRCVCKAWRMLISHPKFISEHFNHSPQSLIIQGLETELTFTNKPQFEEIPLEHYATGQIICQYKVPDRHQNTHSDLVGFLGQQDLFFKYMDVVGCPNGVVCLIQQFWGTNFTLWNPATRTSQPVPPPRIKADPNVHRGVSGGLGFDSSSNDYKIIRIVSPRDLDPTISDIAEVYSVKSGRWRTVKTNIVFKNVSRKCEVVIKGRPYFRVLGDDRSTLWTFLMYFSVQREVFRFETMAPEMNKRELCIGEIQGCLGAVLWEKTKIDVWMKDDWRGWSMIYRVSPAADFGSVVGFYGDSGIVEEVGYEGNLIMYDLEKMEVEDLINVGEVLPGSFKVVSYRESLASIRGRKEIF